MNIRSFFIGRTIGFIVVVILVGGFFLINDLIYTEKQGDNVVPEPIGCTEEAKMCPDGSSVARSGPECNFSECPLPSVDEMQTVVTLGNSGKIMNVTISPQEVVSDSRCPIDVECIWAGTVEVRTILSTEVAHGELTLTLGEPQVFGDYSVILTEVLPVKTQERIFDESYQFIYSIE